MGLSRAIVGCGPVADSRVGAQDKGLNMEITRKIENWVKTTHTMEQVTYSGNLFGDSKGRWYDGAMVRTSKVVKEEGDIIYTLNSIYKLGKRGLTFNVCKVYAPRTIR